MRADPHFYICTEWKTNIERDHPTHYNIERDHTTHYNIERDHTTH